MPGLIVDLVVMIGGAFGIGTPMALAIIWLFS
jgi:hypothetical protein